MTKQSMKTNTQPSVLDAIKGAEAMAADEAAKLANPVTLIDGGIDGPFNETTEQPKEEKEDPKPTAWGSFAIEVGVAPPSKSLANTKYDWASFPAPSDPKDSKTWPSVFIPKIGSKSISGSIKSYRDKLQADGKAAPEFTISVIKDAAKEAIGVRVFRKS
ncbi:hypothetical protein [Mesorhizobium sp. M0767]|uniref:hypothetical protein n=1 Tax=Mesorhizobium sp. M0767 TaxID=2956995 RepID=UPI003339B255